MSLFQRPVRFLLRLAAVGALLFPLPALAHGAAGYEQQHAVGCELRTESGYGTLEMGDCLQGIHPPVHLHCHHAHDGHVLAGNTTAPDREEPDAVPVAAAADMRLFVDIARVVPSYHASLPAVQPRFILFGNFRS